MPYTQKPSTCLRIVLLFFLPALRLAALSRSESQAQSSRPTGRWPRRVFDESSGAAAMWLLRSRPDEAADGASLSRPACIFRAQGAAVSNSHPASAPRLKLLEHAGWLAGCYARTERE